VALLCGLVYDHALGANGIFLRCSRTVALITGSIGGGGTTSWRCSSGSLRLLANDVEHTVLEGLFVLRESVLLPRIVKDEWIEAVPRHAAIEETKAGCVVRLLLEFQGPTVLHELTELAWMSAAELLE